MIIDIAMNKKLIHNGRIFSFISEEVKLPNGVKLTLEIVRHPGASAIVPIDKNGNIILVKQYRYAAGGFIYEIPAGKLDKGEKPLSCAKRELIEETGYSAKIWKKLCAVRTTPGFSDEVIHIYLAKGLTMVGTSHEFDEVMIVHSFTKKQVLKMIKTGKIVDGKTLVGLFYALLI